ncbi:MAG: peptide deformylase [bacterium]
MAVKKIHTDKEKILREKSIKVDFNDPDLSNQILDMVDTLRALPGYGLAAPQIGIQKSIVVIENEGRVDEEGTVISEKLPLTILINPTIAKFSKETCDFEEGCFSVPGYRGNVVRPKKIKAIAFNEKGQIIKINASGLFSRVLQHEIDHINGILFIDLIKDKSLLIPNEPDEAWKELIYNE